MNFSGQVSHERVGQQPRAAVMAMAPSQPLPTCKTSAGDALSTIMERPSGAINDSGTSALEAVGAAGLVRQLLATGELRRAETTAQPMGHNRLAMTAAHHAVGGGASREHSVMDSSQSVLPAQLASGAAGEAAALDANDLLLPFHSKGTSHQRRKGLSLGKQLSSAWSDRHGSDAASEAQADIDPLASGDSSSSSSGHGPMNTKNTSGFFALRPQPRGPPSSAKAILNSQGQAIISGFAAVSAATASTTSSVKSTAADLRGYQQQTSEAGMQPEMQPNDGSNSSAVQMDRSLLKASMDMTTAISTLLKASIAPNGVATLPDCPSASLSPAPGPTATTSTAAIRHSECSTPFSIGAGLSTCDGVRQSGGGQPSWPATSAASPTRPSLRCGTHSVAVEPTAALPARRLPVGWPQPVMRTTGDATPAYCPPQPLSRVGSLSPSPAASWSGAVEASAGQLMPYSTGFMLHGEANTDNEVIATAVAIATMPLAQPLARFLESTSRSRPTRVVSEGQLTNSGDSTARLLTAPAPMISCNQQDQLAQEAGGRSPAGWGGSTDSIGGSRVHTNDHADGLTGAQRTRCPFIWSTQQPEALKQNSVGILKSSRVPQAKLVAAQQQQSASFPATVASPRRQPSRLGRFASRHETKDTLTDSRSSATDCLDNAVCGAWTMNEPQSLPKAGAGLQSEDLILEDNLMISRRSILAAYSRIASEINLQVWLVKQ
jgi:hypothetical protein